MKKSFMHILAVLACVTAVSSCCCKQQADEVVVKPGIEVLRDRGFDILQGKRVGLVTNPSGVDRNLVSTVDILHNAPGVELVALYGPEHGVRGDIHAGDKVEGNVDPKTGIIVHSLYGKTQKPTMEMLEGLDAIIYDIQDIGCRSFTFISTMGKVMEAAAEKGIEVIVLDRPNPLGGEKVEGPLVEEGFFSFVSQFAIPYVYGLTCGELALMLNQEGLLKDGVQCNLTVVPMEGWERHMIYEDTNLPWVLPSPHIPQPASSFYYPAVGIAGELGAYSIGVGYTLPFQMLATEGVDADVLADRLNAKQLPGVLFRPLHVKPFYSMGAGKTLQGVQLYVTDAKAARLTEIQFHILEVIAELNPERAAFNLAPENRHRMFDIVTGNDYFRKTFALRHRFEDIQGRWRADEEAFKTRSQAYYLYK
ncbi:MAG: DUF1343 domain-containing protein [Bacteroidales bacterium]|nr:DUF1343 domain-containing protein [Bacteroidales bacterium]